MQSLTWLQPMGSAAFLIWPIQGDYSTRLPPMDQPNALTMGSFWAIAISLFLTSLWRFLRTLYLVLVIIKQQERRVWDLYKHRRSGQ